MNMKNIHAYTEATGQIYPGYISINQRKPDDGAAAFALTVRSTGGVTQAEIQMTRDQLLSMAEDIRDSLYRSGAGG